MVKATTRTHLLIPKDLLEAIDRLAGSRKRSEFVVDALREKRARERQGIALKEAAGALSRADHPEWETPSAVLAWVREGRATDTGAAERTLRRDPSR